MRRTVVVKVVLMGLLGGVVVNLLVAWGIGWCGVELPWSRSPVPPLLVLKVGDELIEARGARWPGVVITSWVPTPVQPETAAMDQFIEKQRISAPGGSKTAVIPFPDPLKEPRLDDPACVPAWASLWDASEHMHPGPSALVIHDYRFDVATGWPLVAFSVHGYPEGVLYGGAMLEWLDVLDSIRVLPLTPRWPGFLVNSLVNAPVVPGLYFGVRAVVRRRV